MSDDLIEDEMKIISEIESEDDKHISLKAFKAPIGTLELPVVVTLDQATSVKNALSTMQQNNFGSIVLTENNKISGILTERDILMKVSGKITDLDNTPVYEIMTTDPVVLQKEDMIAHVMHNMYVGGFRHIPIIDDKSEKIYMCSIKDIINYILEHIPAEIINVVGEPYRGEPKREGA